MSIQFSPLYAAPAQVKESDGPLSESLEKIYEEGKLSENHREIMEKM